MLRLLLFFRSILPPALWRPLWNAFWRDFWMRAELEEFRELGRRPSDPIAGSERAEFAEALVEGYPFNSVLELGTGYAQNLTVLAKQLPQVDFLGIDSSESCIKSGKAFLAEREFKNIRLLCAPASSLKDYEDDSFDVVVSCAFMLYVEPSEIEELVCQMFRVAKKRIVVLEQHRSAEGEEAHLGDYALRLEGSAGYWVRDYEKLFLRYTDNARLKSWKIPAPRWTIEQWKQLAHLFVIDLD
jgi:SAM-dependent methyltransferase